MDLKAQIKGRRIDGGGRSSLPEIRLGLFQYFVDVWGVLKVRLPIKLFLFKARKLYNIYIQCYKESNDTPKRLLFTQRWLKRWCREFGISYGKLNIRYFINAQERKQHIISFLKNVCSVRYYLEEKLNEQVIYNADEMPLHRNEAHAAKTLNYYGKIFSSYVIYFEPFFYADLL